MQIVELLLQQKDIDVTKCNKHGNNALEAAVVHGQNDVAIAIIKSDKWIDALRNYTVTNTRNDVRRTLCCCNRKRKDDVIDGGDVSGSVDDASKIQFTTPMRMIIQEMPDVAKVVFDRCYKTEGSPYDDNYKITYNYEFLEDFDLQGQHDKWPPPSKYSSQNHCLYILANSPSANLRHHPLVATLFNQKWNKYGKKLYYVNLIFYSLFVILLTSFGFLVHPPNSSKCMKVFGNDHHTDMVIEGSGNDTDAFIDCFPKESFVSQRYISIASVCLMVYSLIMILREVFQLVLLQEEYFTSFVNYIEVSLFILTIVFASVRSNQCYCTQSWQWQIGVIAVFLSWIVLVFSIRMLPVFGIYAVMFIKIFNNFVKVVILALLLISAFAFPFYMMFNDPQDKAQGIRTPFITPWRTILKTIMMTVGEYQMDLLLRQNNQRNTPDVQYPVVSFSLIIVFVILMPILFLNLLTGLAVGDTDEIQKSADACKRTLKVEFTLPIEEFLRRIEALVPKQCKKVKSWIKSLITVEQEHKVTTNKGKKRWKHAIVQYFTTEPQETVVEVKNKSKPLSEEVKDLCRTVSEEVKDLRSSMDQLRDIVNSLRKEIQRGGLEEEMEEEKTEEEEQQASLEDM